MLEFRPYQEDAITSIYDYFGNSAGNPVVAMPTGTGKSVVIAGFVESAMRQFPTTRMMVLTHVKELIEQNYKTLLRHWPLAPAGIYSAGLGRKDSARVLFAGIASIVRRPKSFGHIDLVLIDECHLVSHKEDTGYRNVIDSLKELNPDLRVVGFSATPYRLGAGRVTEGGVFTDFCYDITGLEEFNKLIADGYLAPLVPRKTGEELDVSAVSTSAGDYNLQELQDAVDVSDLTLRIVEEMVTGAQDRKHWLVFCSGIDHAVHVADCLTAHGIPATAIHSKMGDQARDQAIKDFKSGKIRAVTNNNVLTTGFDFPGIDYIGMLRPTQSPGLWVQMLGRGTRPFPGKENCLVHDFAGNTRRLGPINDPVVRKKGQRKGGIAPVKLCGHCGTYNHASVRICTSCGAEFPRVEKLKEEADDRELIAEEPQIDVFRVDAVTYHRWNKQDAPPSIKVVYNCGLRWFAEWVCLEHPGYAGKRSRDWWRARSADDPPATTEEALELVGTVNAPTHIRVWHNKKFPQVMAHDFTGTAFGTGAVQVKLEEEDVPF